MGQSAAPLSNGADVAKPQRQRRRRLPTATEQARREQWGAEWSQVGKDWKRQHEPKGR